MLNNKIGFFLLKFFIPSTRNFNKFLLNGNVFPTFGFFFDRRENDFLNQEIRIFRALDKIDFFAGLNESEPVGSKKIFINDYPELLDFGFS